MKFYINKSLALLAIFAVVIFSCEENEETIGFSEVDNNIVFPDFPDYSATFTTLDQVVLDIEVDGPATSLDVSGSDGDDFGTVTISGGSGTFTSTLAALGNPSSEELSFSDGNSTRLFDLSIVNPVSFTSSTSSSVYLDSTFSVVFEAETENGSIDGYDLFLKIGANSTYSATADDSGTNTGTELEDSVAFAASNATYSIGDTIYYKLDVSSGSLVATKSGSLIVTEVELTKSGELTLRTPDYEISTGVTDSLKNAYNFKAFKYIADSVLATDPDSADISLQENFGDLDLEAGAGSGTTFVIADESFSFASATYESIKAGYDAGFGTSSVSNVESLNTNAVILIELGNIPQSGAPAADNRRYAAIQILGFNKSDGGVTSDVTFDYIAPAQPKE